MPSRVFHPYGAWTPVPPYSPQGFRPRLRSFAPPALYIGEKSGLNRDRDSSMRTPISIGTLWPAPLESAFLVDVAGIEPAASSLRTMRSPS